MRSLVVNTFLPFDGVIRGGWLGNYWDDLMERQMKASMTPSAPWRPFLLLALPVLLTAACATARPPTPPERRVVDDAANALGGMARIQAATTISVEGAGEFFALGQNRTLTGDLLKWQVSEYQRATDFGNRRWRESSIYTPAFVTGWPNPFPVVAGYDNDISFDVEDGQATRVDPIVTRDRRADLYHHPVGFLCAASATDHRLEHAPEADGRDSVDLVAPSGDRYTLTIDRASRLPVRIVSKSHEAALGDVTVATAFGDFRDADGLKVPGRITRRIDGTIVSDIRIAKTTVNGSVGELAAPQDARAATGMPATNVTVEEVSPGIWYLAGEGHHSVLVEFSDHLTLVEAPVDDRRTLAVIAKARELRPSKPLTEVVNTHHHFDHSGGIRAAIAEGLTVITHEDNRPFFQAVATRPATVAPDALAKRPRPLSIETVTDRKVLTDGRRTVEIHPITDNAHCASMLMIYFPAERLLAEADAYQPPPLKGPAPLSHPFAANLLENIEKRGLRVERILPIHGRIVPFADFVAAARPTQ